MEIGIDSFAAAHTDDSRAISATERVGNLVEEIEVGALAAPERGKRYGKVLARQLVHMTGKGGKFSFVTDSMPFQLIGARGSRGATIWRSFSRRSSFA